jgi:hypothetical protein
MLGPGEPQLSDEESLDVLCKTMLQSVRAVGHIARLVGVRVV